MIFPVRPLTKHGGKKGRKDCCHEGQRERKAAWTPLRNFLVRVLLSDIRFRLPIVPKETFFSILPIFAIMPPTTIVPG